MGYCKPYKVITFIESFIEAIRSMEGSVAGMPFKTINLFLFLCYATSALLLCGCATTNYYEKFYSPLKSSNSSTNKKTKDVDVQFLDNTNLLDERRIEIIERGFEVLGVSSFIGTHCPWSCAVEQAKKIGANLVLISEKYYDTVSRSWVSVSSHSSSYTSPYGTTTTTTTGTATPYVRETDRYATTALFFREKVQGVNFYGVVFDASQELLPAIHSTPLSLSEYPLLSRGAKRAVLD